MWYAGSDNEPGWCDKNKAWYLLSRRKYHEVGTEFSFPTSTSTSSVEARVGVRLT